MKIPAVIKDHKWSFIGLFLAVMLWLTVVILDLDLFETFAHCMTHHEAVEFDELFFPAVILYIFLMIDLIFRHHRNQIKIENLKVYRAMVQAMNHVLNNFLQKMLLFKMTADETEGFDPDVLKQYNEIIDQTVAQIKALESIENPSEKQILETVLPDPTIR